jgi:hypothetical protein
MAIFESTEKMYEVLGGLFTSLTSHPKAGPKFAGAGIIIRFIISDPNGEIWLTPGDGTKGEVICGSTDLKATIEMTLSGDTCHKFWLKQVSMPVALAKRLIKARGPMPKVLKLLPLLGPAYEAYPDIAKEHGIET